MINVLIIQGVLDEEPISTTTKSNKLLVNFTLRVPNGGDMDFQTHEQKDAFFKMVAWGEEARQISEYPVGANLLIQAKLTQSVWVKNGEELKSNKILVTSSSIVNNDMELFENTRAADDDEYDPFATSN
jgi:single-stranded DNA-binding protein